MLDQPRPTPFKPNGVSNAGEWLQPITFPRNAEQLRQLEMPWLGVWRPVQALLQQQSFVNAMTSTPYPRPSFWLARVFARYLQMLPEAALTENQQTILANFRRHKHHPIRAPDVPEYQALLAGNSAIVIPTSIRPRVVGGKLRLDQPIFLREQLAALEFQVDGQWIKMSRMVAEDALFERLRTVRTDAGRFIRIVVIQYLDSLDDLERTDEEKAFLERQSSKGPAFTPAERALLRRLF